MGYGTVNSVTMTKAPALLTRYTLSHISSPLFPSFSPIQILLWLLNNSQVTAAQLLINKV